MSKEKGFARIIILVGIMVLLIAGGFVFWSRTITPQTVEKAGSSPSPSPAVRYINFIHLGGPGVPYYQMEIPSDWSGVSVPNESTPFDVAYLGFSHSEYDENEFKGVSDVQDLVEVKEFVSARLAKIDPGKWSKVDQEGVFGVNPQSDSWKNVSIGGLPARQFKYFNGQSGQDVEVFYLAKDSTIFIFTPYYDGPQFEHMMETFKILDDQPPITDYDEFNKLITK